MVPTAQAASNPDVTNQFICIGEQQVQYCILAGGAFNYLIEKVILNVLQESLGLHTAHHATFPADVWVVEVPEQNERLQYLLQLEVEGLIYRLCLIWWPVVDINHKAPFAALVTVTHRLLTCS